MAGLRKNINCPGYWDNRYMRKEYASANACRMQRIIDSYTRLTQLMNPSGERIWRMLDVGCGEGAAANYYAEQGWDAFGCDFCQLALIRAREGWASGGTEEPPRKFKKIGVFVPHDVSTPLPFENEVFDVVLALDILEHMDDPRELAQQMMRILRPGGFCYFTVPDQEHSLDFPEHVQAFDRAQLEAAFSPYPLLRYEIEEGFEIERWGLVQKNDILKARR